MSRITVNRKEFSQALTIARRTIAKGGSMPILGCVRIEPKDKMIVVKTTDLEVATLVDVRANVETEDPLVVGLKELAAAVKAQKTELLQLDWEPEVPKVKAGTVTLMTHEPTDCPTLPHHTTQTAESFTTGLLAQALRETSYAMSKDETRYNLNGLHVEDVGDAVLFTATDGHRLAHHRLGGHVMSGCPKSGWILPAKWVDALEKLICCKRPYAPTVTIRSHADGQPFASAIVGNVVLQCRLIEGEFPNYRQVIPQRNGRQVHFDPAALKDAIAQVEVVAGASRNHGIKVQVSQDLGIQLRAENPDLGEAEAQVEADVAPAASGIVFGVNVHYLRQAVESFTAERLTLYLDKPRKQDAPMDGPMAIQPNDSPSLAVVMPMRM